MAFLFLGAAGKGSTYVGNETTLDRRREAEVEKTTCNAFDEGTAINLQIKGIIEPNKDDIKRTFILGDDKSLSIEIVKAIEEALV